MQNLNLITEPWKDYELLDSGDNRKLERYGKFIIARPETQAIWKPARPELWKQAVAEFEWADGKGKWKQDKNIPESWQLGWNDIRFTIQLTSFKHTGIFPEQAENWKWISSVIPSLRGILSEERIPRLMPRNDNHSGFHILNLFGYTGIASIVAAKNGAQVTHVDASKQSNQWAKENAGLSGVPTFADLRYAEGSGEARASVGKPDGSIRFLLDDALKFAEREVRRGVTYEGIILDPPAFGRGAKGEVWHIEEQLPRLLDALAKLLSKKPGAFFLLNGYAAGYSPQSFLQAVESSFAIKNVRGEFGELSLKESNSERIVPQGIYVRFVLL